MQSVPVAGDIPPARFGHTTTLVSSERVVLFGGATGDTGKYAITGDTFIFDLGSNKWSRMEPSGLPPTPRAAHGACCVDQLQLVIYGGATGGGSLASDDLYLLDLRQGPEQSQWMIVPVVGTTPGRRYGHVLAFQKPFLILHGGNTGTEPVDDVWCLNVEKAPFSWARLQINGAVPPARVYHSAASCSEGSAAGMMVVFGGRTNDGSPLADTWGLRKHRDGRWDWVQAPYKKTGQQPTSRYQHSSLFIGSKMVVIGGRTNEVNDILDTEIFDTETSDWIQLPPVRRFRHSSWMLGALVFVCGGFAHDNPGLPSDDLSCLDITEHLRPPEMPAVEIMSPEAMDTVGPLPGDRKSTPRTDIRLARQAVVAVDQDDFVRLVRKVSIDRLEEEGKRLASGPGPAKSMHRCMSVEGIHTLVVKHLLRPKDWTPPRDGSFQLRREQILALIDEVQVIFQEQPMVLKLRAPIKIYGDIHGQFSDLMRLFDLYGAPADGEGGDIESMDYLFLGDYVDRGAHSLEVLCLLLSLKIKYPDQIHIIRGNHEDLEINQVFGFRDECRMRLNEDPDDPNSVWRRFNQLFEWLPIAAVIEDRVLCLHGGIGCTLKTVAEMEALKRPLIVQQDVQTAEHQIIIDILWSDPTDNDGIMGITENPLRDPSRTGSIVKFGPDRVTQFLEANNLRLIVRAHECVMDGFERFASGHLITLFSATDYCGRHKNAGALLLVRRDLTVVPKLIYPVKRMQQTWVDGEEGLKKRPPTPPRRTGSQRRLSFE
eukprot:GILJ01004593.1.p1 GENE.GILJ01004593.1~~GILJ01004593.1.p1  ORF type:complete len:767 (-),score=86.58 GILJ01004593.1:414-2714(-)